MLAGAGAHNRRPGDHCDLAFGRAGALQFASQLANDGRFRFVGVNNGVNELKKICARRCTLHRHHAHAPMTHHDLVVFAHVEEFYCSGRAFFSINSNRAIHHGGLHFDLLAVKPDESLLVGCHVEVTRKNPVCRSGGKLRIRVLGDFGAVLSQAQNQFVERFARFGRHFDSGKALVRPLFADLDLANLKIRAASQNLIQHLWQDERIDDMTA